MFRKEQICRAPVMNSGKVVGMITGTKLFKILLGLMGAREKVIRVTTVRREQPGGLAQVSQAIANNSRDFIALGRFASPDTDSRVITFDVQGMKKEKIEQVVGMLC